MSGPHATPRPPATDAHPPVTDPAASPVHQAVWGPDVPVAGFDSVDPVDPPAARAAMDRALETVRRHMDQGSVYGEDGLVSPAVEAELGHAGYWALRVPQEHGGYGLGLGCYARHLGELFALSTPVGGLGVAHAALGPVTSLTAFGTRDQRERLLPPLARGARLGAFASTEPGTSSDLAALRTEAVRDGDRLLLTGEKLLITNAAPGRTVSVLSRLDGELRMVVVELPDHEDETFRTRTHGLTVYRHLPNHGLVFQRLPVPADNVLPGDGRAVAYHAINRGRVVVAAGAAAAMRRMLTSLVPWVQTRQTFGAAIGSRELVQRRLGRLAARVVLCDALLVWSGGLLDAGHRGELEAVVAKVVSSEALKEVTVDVLLKTHGGRALLDGNLFADEVHELLAPTVFEGENEILTLGFFAALARRHGEYVLQPLARAMSTGHGDGGGVTGTVRGLWASRAPLTSYAVWTGRRQLRQAVSGRRHVPTGLHDLAELAGRQLQSSGLEISAAMRHEGSRLAEHQAEVFDLAQRVQHAAAMLVVARYGARQHDPLRRDAAACMAAELGYRLTGDRPDRAFHRLVTDLGGAVADGRFRT